VQTDLERERDRLRSRQTIRLRPAGWAEQEERSNGIVTLTRCRSGTSSSGAS